MFEIQLIDRRISPNRYEASDIDNPHINAFGEQPFEAICGYLLRRAHLLNVGIDNIQRNTSTNHIRLQLTAESYVDPQPQNELLSMTFRQLVKQKLKKDRRIKGIPFFHGHLNFDINDTYLPEDFRKYGTLGDVPLSVLIAQTEWEFLKMKGVARKAILALRAVLSDFNLKINE